MKRIFCHLLIAATAGTTVFAQDTIVFKNGDVLTGTILKQDATHVDFTSESFGSVSLNTPDIAEIRIETPELGEISVPAEAIAPEPAPPATQAAAPAPAPAPPAKAPSKWTGQVGLAIAMREKTSSNQKGVVGEESYETYRIYGNVNWKSDRNTLRWDWTYRYSEDEYRVRDDFFNVTQIYKYAFENQNLYSTAKTLYQRDYNRRIENEFLQTAEMGIKWFGKDSSVQLSTSAGGGYHSYERVDPSRTSSSTVTQPEFIFDESLRWNMINTLALTQRYTHLGDLTNYHFLFSAGLENKLVKDLFIRFEYRLDRDTEVYYDDRGYYDKALLTSLLYKF